MKKIMTMSEFAELINEADEWKAEFAEIIEANGWVDDNTLDNIWGVCHNDLYRIEIREDGKAVVL